MAFVQYCLRVLSIAFSGAWAIANGVSFLLPIFAGYYVWKRPHWESTMKNLLWAIPLAVFVVFLTVSVAIVAPYRIYQEQQQTIAQLKNVHNTKQDIRNFFESVDPIILQKIDAGQKEIHVSITTPEQMKLLDLSKYPDFDKFLSFKQTEGVITFIGGKNRTGVGGDYCFYPKDAITK